MSKSKFKSIIAQLEQVRRVGSGSVTYHFKDGTMLKQNINMQIFKTAKGNYTPLTEIIKIFNTTMHDNYSAEYTINC